MKKWRVGVVGAGRFGRLHLAVWRQFAECEIAALAELDPGLLRQTAGEFGIPRASADARDLFRDPSLDAVDIVSDEASHGALALEALRHGKHVFVEKPLATSLAAAEQIAELAERSGRAVVAGNISRFSAPYACIKRALDMGKLGRPRFIQTKRHFSQAWFEHFGKRVHTVFESGIHDLDLILWYAGSACREVYAAESRSVEYLFPDIMTATLRFEDGLLAALHSAWLVPRGAPQTLIGTLELDGTIDAELELCGTRATARYRLAHSGLSLWTGSGVEHPELTLWPLDEKGVGGALRAELRHFLLRARAGRPSEIAPLRDSVQAIRIAEALIRSAAENRPIAV